MAAASPAISQPIQRRQSMNTCCSSCKGSVKAGQHALCCSHCDTMIHLTCSLKLFKEATNEPLKNKIDWLQEFITFSSLIYQCKACTEKLKTVPTSVIDANTKVNDDIFNIKQSIATLDGKISSILSSISLCNGGSQSSTTSTSTSVPTFAEVTSADIANVVQRDVSHSLRSKTDDDLANSSIIIFGLPESNNDLTKVRRLLEDDIQSVVRVQRIGKFSKPTQQVTDADKARKSSSTIRPLRVQLKQVEDRYWVMQNAGSLIRAFGNSGVHIAKCLTTKELDILKSQRSECSRLNSFVPKLNNGNNRLVVVNCKIMERSEGGHLIAYDSSKWSSKLPASASAAVKSRSDSVSSSVTKNG